MLSIQSRNRELVRYIIVMILQKVGAVDTGLAGSFCLETSINIHSYFVDKYSPNPKKVTMQ